MGARNLNAAFHFHRIVLKLGTSVLTAGTPFLNRPRLIELVRQCAQLHQAGVQVILVSSGAMAAGKEQMGFPDLPADVPAKQMLSAIGQPRLMGIYQQFFDIYGIPAAQMLLTRQDLQLRRRYLNARQTLHALLVHHTIPIINENDTVTAEEIRVGDNDNLSAMVATLAEADLLILLTDQQGLFTADPRTDSSARLIPEVAHIDEGILASAGGAGSALGTGGMITKIQAAETATRSGATVIIAAGDEPDVVLRLARGEAIGTRFLPRASAPESRKRWLLAGYTQSGRLIIDAGAVQALRERGGSLLPIGIVDVKGAFQRGDTIGVFTSAGRELARGLVRYSHEDIRRIARHHSDDIEAILGYTYGPTVIHRNDLVLL